MTDYTEKFGTEAARFQDSSKELRYAIIATHSGILGLTASLMEAPVSWWIIGTWVLQIIGIGLGFLIVKLSMDQQFAGSFRAFRFSMDMDDIHTRETSGELLADSKKRSGIYLALMKDSLEGIVGESLEARFTLEGKALIEKYQSELLSRKLLKDSNVTPPVIRKLSKHASSFINAFYIFSSAAFFTLLVGVILKSAPNLGSHTPAVTPMISVAETSPSKQNNLEPRIGGCTRE